MENINEEWRVIPWSNGLYYASNLGNIKRKEGLVVNQLLKDGKKSYRKIGGKNLSQKTKSNGYKEVNLAVETGVGKMCYVHRAVFFSFNPDADNSLQINHKNLIKSDNRLENLELVTQSENMIHAYRNGAINRRLGIICTHKLTIEQVKEIRKMYEEKKDLVRIKNKFNIGKSQIQRIVKRQSWVNVL